MTPGPKPKPAEIAEAQGNPGHRPLAKTPAAVPQLEGAAPEWLSERGRQIWADMLQRFRPLPYVKSTDHGVLARYCDHVDRWLRLRAKVEEQGEAYETKSRHGDMLRVNPHFRAMMAIEEKMATIEDRFGLTPAARQSILARYQPDQDMGDELALGTTHTPQPVTAGASPLGLFAPAKLN
jgi:P27 family predicted phage terminase small subunit